MCATKSGGGFLMHHLKEKSGFTLIELLVVIAIIAILAAILFPVFMQAKMSARGTACMNNLKQLSLAFRAYNENWNQRFMPAAGWGYVGQSWPAYGFPYVLKKGGYIKNDKVFCCPSAPKKFESDTWFQQEDNPDAPDTGWIWHQGMPDECRANYGNNIALGGWSPSTGDWIGLVPMESQIPSPTKVIYLTDSRWVDLFGGAFPGRIGDARRRHNDGANALCCDGHCKWLPVTWANQWPQPSDANPKWDYRR